jgi:CMP/dCMP kinase
LKIFIAGLSGTGKSTIAEQVAKKFKLKYYPSSLLFRKFAGKDVETNGWWEKEGLNFVNEREGSDIDEQFDKYLLNLIDTNPDFVIDSWTLPWLYKEEGLRIFLKAPFEVRVNRVVERDELTYAQIKEGVARKDKLTRAIYMKKYMFDITKDHNIFDFVINTEYFNKKEITKLVFNIVKKYRDYF